MDLGMKGMTALITGASKGIGLALAYVLAKEGCNLHLAARNGAAMEEARAKIEAEYGVKVTVHALDLSSSEVMEALAADVGDSVRLQRPLKGVRGFTRFLWLTSLRLPSPSSTSDARGGHRLRRQHASA